jgi:RNA polymerase sigma-B factor
MESPVPERNTGDSSTLTLLRLFHERGDTAARQRLIELYLPLVESLARRYSKGSDSYDDLYQVGCIGLINAIDRFEIDRGGELAAFAVPNIAGEIKRYLRDRTSSVRLPRRVLELRAPAAEAQRELAAKLGRAPTRAELARKLGADEADVDLALGSAGETVSLEGSLGHRAGEGTVETADDHMFLLEAAQGLDERERQILYLRYMKDLDPDEVASELGISRRQLSRNTQTALAKLRHSLEQGANAGAPRAAASRQVRSPTAKPESEMASVPARADDRQTQKDQPYHIELVREAGPEGDWVATVEELSGCTARGANPDEAVRRVEESMRDWIANARAKGREVPRPRSPSSYSGHLHVRMPQTLHAELARAAEREDVSLNQFITSSLSSVVRWRAGAEPGPREREVVAPPGGPRANRGVILFNVVVLTMVAAVALVLLVLAIVRGF